MGGVEKSRNKYYLDETEVHSNGITFKVTLIGKRELVSLRSQFWAFRLGVCIIMPLNMEVTIEGVHGMLTMETRRQHIHSALADHLGKWQYTLCSPLMRRWTSVGVSAGLEALT